MMNGTVVDAEKKPATKRQWSAKCPIDSEGFDTVEELSQHMDQVHIGPGLLQAYGRKPSAPGRKEKPK